MLSFFQSLNKILWGAPIILILLGTHLYFTLRLGFIQKKTWLGIKLSITPEKTAANGFSGFGALTTTLAATLGTGNIIGISTAIALGGPGAVFWCWITGLLGMATTYAECYLALLFRRKNEDGHFYGGPMYALEDGLKKKGIAICYALLVVLASFGVGCTTQANSISNTASYLWRLPPGITGIIISLVVGFVLIGGASSIEKLCMKLVPAMGGAYLVACVILLLINLPYFLPALVLIMKSAFSLPSFSGGIMGGIIAFSVKAALRYGIARGLFTNEAGLGSAAIAAAGSDTENPARQSLISMTATFWDTVVLCAITGIVIVCNLLNHPESIIGKDAGGLTHAAFEAIPFGSLLIGLCLILFAFATLIGWSYFGQQAFLYLFSPKYLKGYYIIYLIMIFLGAVSSLELVWEITDTINVLMAVPNLIALYGLRKLVKGPGE